MNHVCPLCKTSYPSDINFCVKDGARLIAENITVNYTNPQINNPFERQPQNGLPYYKASIGNRFAAILIDGLIFIGLMIPAGVTLVFAFIYAYGNKEGIAITLCIIGGLLTLIPIAFQLLKDGFKNGQSPGKRAMKLMVIDLDTNMPCTRKKSCLRNVIVLLLGFVPFVGSFIEPVMVFATADGRRLGDRAANTMVIDKSQYFN
ncbi:RDD family protein [Pedobacter sp. ASV1-7]|uniref:RDD family protein n=1 Tax=Pedobacter sp. ASV1-7 TaxID=3145237 RepID=UPI0032E8C172